MSLTKVGKNIHQTLTNFSRKQYWSFTFRHPVICHFVNAWNHIRHRNKYKITLQSECCIRILQACVNAGHFNLLEIFIQNLASPNDAKVTDLLMLAAKGSSVEIFDLIRIKEKTSEIV